MNEIDETRIKTREAFNAVNLHTLIGYEDEAPSMELVRAAASLSRTETLCCVTRKDIDVVLRGINGYSGDVREVNLYAVPRSVAEFIGDWIQIVAGVCIHTDKKCLFLRLKEAHPFVSGYNEGTTTFPMGHVRCDKSLKDCPVSVITNWARQGAIRELFEEVYFPWMGYGDSSLDHSDEKNVLRSMIDGAGAYAYYSNTGVSSLRHLGVIFDVNVCGNLELSRYFEDDNHELVSNEPEKHTVEIMDYYQLIRALPSTDYLGAYETLHMQGASWWRKTFLGSTFIRPDLYQKKGLTCTEPKCEDPSSH